MHTKCCRGKAFANCSVTGREKNIKVYLIKIDEKRDCS
jgi:hypothetical protein